MAPRYRGRGDYSPDMSEYSDYSISSTHSPQRRQPVRNTRRLPPFTPAPTGVNPGALRYVPTERVIELASPLDRATNKPVNLPAKVHTEALHYIPTRRIVELATPVDREQIPASRSLPERVRRSALQYEPSKRIRKLAVPKSEKKQLPDLTLPLKVSDRALHYQPTARITKLASPIHRDNLESPEIPGKVKQSALKYTATARIQLLSKPRRLFYKQKLPEVAENVEDVFIESDQVSPEEEFQFEEPAKVEQSEFKHFEQVLINQT